MWRKRKPADFQAELDAHLELEADALREEGLPDDDARAAARRALGNRTSAEERFYESSRWMFGQHLFRDLRFAVRVLSKEPKFAILTILGLALGIGVSTAIFMFVAAATGQYNGSGFRQAEDVRNPASYISIDRTSQEFQTTFSFAAFQVLKDHATTLDQLAAESDAYGFVLASRGLESVNVTARFESEDFLPVRGFRPALGRSFSNDADCRSSGSPRLPFLAATFCRRSGGSWSDHSLEEPPYNRRRRHRSPLSSTGGGRRLLAFDATAVADRSAQSTARPQWELVNAERPLAIRRIPASSASRMRGSCTLLGALFIQAE